MGLAQPWGRCWGQARARERNNSFKAQKKTKKWRPGSRGTGRPPGSGPPQPPPNPRKCPFFAPPWAPPTPLPGPRGFLAGWLADFLWASREWPGQAPWIQAFIKLLASSLAAPEWNGAERIFPFILWALLVFSGFMANLFLFFSLPFHNICECGRPFDWLIKRKFFSKNS